jgi:ankyrin repeat protein
VAAYGRQGGRRRWGVPVVAALCALASLAALTLAPPPAPARLTLDCQLVRAVEAGNLEGTRRALRRGADPNSVDDEVCPTAWPGSSPDKPAMPALVIAARGGRVDIVRELLARGASLGARSSPPDNDDALMAAVMFEHADVVALLLRAGANPYAAWEGRSTLDVAEEWAKGADQLPPGAILRMLRAAAAARDRRAEALRGEASRTPGRRRVGER